VYYLIFYGLVVLDIEGCVIYTCFEEKEVLLSIQLLLLIMANNIYLQDLIRNTIRA
jgi:hypothetical protein